MLSFGLLSIKKSFSFFVLILIMNFTFLQAQTINPNVDKLKSAVDIAITAISSQSLDPGISTILSVIPAWAKGTLILTPHANMQSITDAIMDHPSRQPELLELRNRYQAILSAVNGDSSRWNDIVKEEQDKKKKRKTIPIVISKQDILELETFVDSIKNRVYKLDAQIRELEMCRSKMSKNISLQNKLIKAAKEELKHLLPVPKRAATFCEDAKKTRKNIDTISYEIEQGKGHIESSITIAKQRFNLCKTANDEVFIKSNYYVAQDYLSRLKLAYNDIEKNLELLALKLDAFKTTNASTTPVYKQLLKDKKTYYDYDGDINACEKRFNKTLPEIKKDILNLQAEHKKFYQKYEIFFHKNTTRLNNRLVDIHKNRLNDVRKYAKDLESFLTSINALLMDYDYLNENYKKTISKYDRYPTIDWPRGIVEVYCMRLEPSGEKVKIAGKDYLYARDLVQSNSSLMSSCREKTSPPVVKLPKTNTGTPTAPPITSTNTNPYNAYDVARIVGPTQLYVGDAVTYTAINPNNLNAVYTTGSFTWNNTRQDLLSLGGSGNTVTGVAMKPGKFTLQLTYGERGVAYLDGEIKQKKKKKNIFNMSSIDKAEDKGPSKDTKKNSIFNMSSIDKGTPIKKSNCDSSYKEAKSAFISGNLDAAQAVLDKSGDCVEWVYNAQNTLDKAQRNKLCKALSARMHAATQANNVNEVIILQKRAGENQCIISQNIWENGNNMINAQEEAKRNEERRYQANIRPSPQPNQTANAMDFFNVLSNGIAAIQQQKDLNDRRKPHPLPNSNLGDRKWQGQSTSSNGSGGGTSNKVSQIIYRVSGSGYVPHYGGKSYKVQGYHDVLVSIKAPATKESILRKAKQKYNTDPCKVGASATPSTNRPPAIWKTGPEIKLIKGPSPDLSNVKLQRTWRSTGSDGPSLSTLKKGCR